MVGPEYHTKLISSQLNQKGIQTIILNKDNLLAELKNVDVVHAIYAFHSVPTLILSKIFGKKVICHWIGSDVLSLHSLFYRFQAAVMNLFIDSHLAGSENLADELKHSNIQAEVMPIVPGLVLQKLKPLPRKLTVLAYLPESSYALYNADNVIKLAEQMPDTNFMIVGTDGTELPKLPNITYLGWVKMTEIYPKATVLLRIPKHDGMSLMVLEALLAGRYVIYSNDFPFCHKFTDMNDAKSYVEQIKKTKHLNLNGSNFVKSNFSSETIIQNMICLYNKLIMCKK